MFSMTGYGKGEVQNGGIGLSVEIKTVNNRYLDVSVKGPRIFVAYEERVRAIVRGKLTRGHADVFISLLDKRERAKELYVDEAAAGSYVGAAARLKAMFPSLPNDFTVTALMKCPDVLRQEEAQGADEPLLEALEQALGAALENLNGMRAKEGEKLAADMLARVDTIEALVQGIAQRAPLVADNYRIKLAARIKEALGGTVDEARILTEAAVFADKANIDEELTRLRSHVGQFRAICREERVGRKLDFLIQEFNRECNTVCSKSNDAAITALALKMKNEIEKVREQIQNIE